MTPAWAWPLSVLGCAGWALFGLSTAGHIIRWMRKHPVPGAPSPPQRRAPAPGPDWKRLEKEVWE